MRKTKIIRTSAVAGSLGLLKGQLSFLNQHYEIIAVSSKSNRLFEIGNSENIKVIPVEMKRRISLLKDIVSLYKLYILFKKEKPLIVHSITPKAGLLTMLAGKFASVPIRLHTFTGLIFPIKTGRMQKLLIMMDKLLCWAATDIYPEGNGVKQDLMKYKITSKPLKVLANGNINGIDLNYFSKDQISEEHQLNLKKELGINKNDFVFVFVGRLVGDKGINELVEAFSKLRIQNSKLLLVGLLETDLDPLRQMTLKEIEYNNDIISVGFQKDVRPYLAISKVLILPSYREGFPNVVLQAGAMELPAIVSDINGANEIIINGHNGTIVPVKDVDALLNAMKKNMEDKNYYEQVKLNTRQMIQSRYEQKVVWNALLDEYNYLVNK